MSANSPLNITKVLDSPWPLYVSNLSTAKKTDHLASLGIKTVISIGHKCDATTHFFDFEDEEDTNLLKQIKIIIPIMRDAERAASPTLVHCHFGQSRSPAIIIAYLMIYRGMAYGAASTYLKKIRPTSYPNQGFINQLEKLDKEINAITSEQRYLH